jgi:hypothetical protein
MNRREARLHKMKQKKEKDLEEAKKGITFPEYNPPPKRKEDMTKSEKSVKSSMKYQSYLRNRPKSGRAFVGWEYKDRQSHKKSS